MCARLRGGRVGEKPAERTPAAFASSPSREPLDGSPPLSLLMTSPPFFRPGPLIVACEAPLPSAAEATPRAPSATSASTERRFMTAPFDRIDAVSTPVPRERFLDAGAKRSQRIDRSLQTDARAEPARPDGRRRRVDASDRRGRADERRLEVGDQVVRRLEPDRQSDEVARSGERRVRRGGVRHPGGVLDEALDAAERLG